MSSAQAHQIFERLRELVRVQSGIEEIELDTELTEDLGLDSLARVELACAVEDEFGVEFERADAQRLRTVSDLIDFVFARV